MGEYQVNADIHEVLQNTCDKLDSVIQYIHNSGSLLDSCTHSIHLSESRKEEQMAQKRMRVQVGTDVLGNPVIKQVSAMNELDLSDKVIRAVVESGRIYEFIAQPFYIRQDLVQHNKPKHSFCEYLDNWIATYKSGLEAGTNMFYSTKINVLKRAFPNAFIEDITTETIQSFLNERAKSNTFTTVKQDIAMLRAVLDSAVQDEIIVKNPARDKRIKNKAPKSKGTKALSAAQAASILQAIPTLQNKDERLLLSLLIHTSMRREEIVALRWENVDLDSRIINIDSAITYVYGKITAKGTKSSSGTRQFPIGEQLYETLAPLYKQSGYVIESPDGSGRPLTQSYYRKLWDSLASHVDLYGMTSRNFRTTFCTLAIASGVDLKTTQTLMGHADPELTMRVYAKQEQSNLPDALNRLNNYLTNATAAI